MSDIYKKAVLESINALLVALGEEPVSIEKLEQEPKPWPQVGDKYWCVVKWRKDGVFQTIHTDASVDYFRIATGNCHRTEAEALAYREWQTDPRVVARGMIERMEGFDPKGEWHIIFNAGLVVGTMARNYAGLTFKTKSYAQFVSERYPALCKVALGVITDKEEGSRIVMEAMGK